MTRRLLAHLAAAVLVLGVAACGPDEPEPRNTTLIDLGSDEASDGGGDEPSDGGGDQPETAHEPSAAPDIPAPDPADFPRMNEESSEGARDAFRYYITLALWSRQTGDSSRHTELENGTCQGCATWDEEVEELREKGAYWTDLEMVEKSVESFEDSKSDYDVRFTFDITSHSRPGEAEGEVVQAPPLRYVAVGAMEWGDDGWRVAGLTVNGSDEF